jgi:hypothetical protein
VIGYLSDDTPQCHTNVLYHHFFLQRSGLTVTDEIGASRGMERNASWIAERAVAA